MRKAFFSPLTGSRPSCPMHPSASGGAPDKVPAVPFRRNCCMTQGLRLFACLALLLLSPGCVVIYHGAYSLAMRAGERPIHLYGYLLDQYGSPIGGATILYETERYGLLAPVFRKGRTASDSDGFFVISTGSATYLFINDVVKHGYEFRRASDGNHSCVGRSSSSRSNPLVYRLRKRQAPGTYLLKNSFGISLKAGDGEAYWCGDLANGWSYFSRSAFVSPEAFPDLEVTGVLDRERREWRLTIRTNGGQSGIQIRDDLLYEAPADGYARTLDIAFPFTERLRFPIRYLYVRLREPGMYARFRIDNSSESSDQRLHLRCEGVINPYGDRSFEPLSFNADVDFRGFSQCRKEATEAFEKQRLAPRPPFEEWVRDGHARY